MAAATREKTRVRARPWPDRSRRSSPGGFSLVEVLVVVGIIGILLAILVPVFAKVRNSSRSVQCLSNLRQIGAAFQSYAMTNQGRLPDPGVCDQSWEQMLVHIYAGP